MKGAVRVALLLFTALRIQRVLLWIGGGLIALGCLFPPPGGAVGVILGSVLAMVPLMFTSGLMLRYFVAPRTLRLIPHSRAQVLGGMLLVTASIATVAALLAWRYGVPPGPFWLLAATVTSLILLTEFPAASSVHATTIWLAALIMVAQSVNHPGVRNFVTSIARSPATMSLILVVGWTVFGIWFTRARAFSPPGSTRPPSRRISRVDPSSATAIRTFLTGNPSSLNPYAGGLVAVVFMVLTFWLMSLFLPRSGSFADLATNSAGAALALGAYAGNGGWLVVSRSKFLWLRGTVDRAEVLHLCERQAWKFYAATSVSVIALFLLLSWLKPESTAKFSLILLFYSGAGVCLLYLGLMHVRGWRALDFICTFGLIVLLIVPAGMIGNPRWLPPWVQVAMFVATAAIALAYRLITVHRWRNIDWLECRPPRPGARGLQEALS